MDEASIFLEALNQPSPEERAAFLQSACGGDDELLRSVALLLKAHDRAGAFLNQPPPDLVATERRGVTISDRVIGLYKLREIIGEGGFGVVYVAEQEKPVRRKVALKVIKPGMASRDVIARFEAERQALALMDHPNVAKVLDAGATESDQPYFVMELVKGTSITEFCDSQRLSTRQRLELFVDVCRAVQHAHQKGIIHRDLKPSNVMVTMRDDRPIPKVIDFGVSKALSQRLTDKTVYTAYGQMLGTPLYMSPEQAQLNEIDVDTRSDVYSLGVLLYELLTGTTPFDKATLHKSGFDEMRRIIREVDPPRPSIRVSTLEVEALSTVSDRRRVDPRRLSQSLRGELDWIVMKALEKDRNRRYESASTFANDVERYLNDEPVQACPPSSAYRFRKFVRRRKAALVSTVIVAASLVGASGISVWQAVYALRAKGVAESSTEVAEQRQLEAIREASRARAVSDLLEEMINSASPATGKGAEYTVRELLDSFSAKYDERVGQDPEVEATVRAIIGRTYGTLRDYDKSEPQLRRALELRRSDSSSMEFADSEIDYATYLMEVRGDTVLPDPTAYQLIQDAMSIYEAHGSAEGVLKSLRALQKFHKAKWDWAEADRVAERALSVAQEEGLMESPFLAIILHDYANTRRRQGDVESAIRLATQAVELHRRVNGDQHVETAWGLVYLRAALADDGQYAAAEPVIQECLAIFQHLYGEKSELVGEQYVALGDVQKLRNHVAEAEQSYRRAISIFEQLQGDGRTLTEHFKFVGDDATVKLLTMLDDQGRADEADQILATFSPQSTPGRKALQEYLDNRPEAKQSGR